MEYNITYGNIEDSLHAFFTINSFSGVFVLVDELTREHCYPKVRESLPSHELIQIESGEINKNMESCLKIWRALTVHNANRNSILVNLGGGVITDMGGFCASCFKRGINFIHIPTTLLSQVDASVGGKTGVDLDGYKNQIGLFSDPQTVFIDHTFLKTLPERIRNAGFAEVIKHSLIRDPNFFEYLETNQESLNIEMITQRAVEIKQHIVLEDFKELGIRKLLNFGHTIGHALESFCLNKEKELLHGEAIAIGMKVESLIAVKMGLLDHNIFDRIAEVIDAYFPDLILEKGHINHDTIMELILHDKKNSTQKPNFTLLQNIGKGIIDQHPSDKLILESLKYFT